MAERLGMGLQNLVQRFESAWYLFLILYFTVGDFLFPVYFTVYFENDREGLYYKQFQYFGIKKGADIQHLFMV